MRIALTGAAGFIGSHVAEAYLAEGHRVVVFDNLSTGWRSHVPEGASLHEVDIHSREFERLIREFRPEVINHHAAQASVKVSTGDPVRDLEANGGGTARVAALAAEVGTRKLIYSGSGGTVYGSPTELPISETQAPHPESPYGLSKWVGEQYIHLFHQLHGLDFTILRYSNAFGPRQDPYGEAGVVAIFTAKMLDGTTCTIDGDGEQRKDYLYVGDIARANVLALDRGSAGTYNIGAGVPTSVNEIFRALQAATGSSLPARHGPPRVGDVRNFWLDCSLAKRELGWEATTSFDQGIELTVAAFRKQQVTR
ncbi:MAG: NAD-dependent epimerase/dehydratase family protein [Dehalococcoidia bacterium]|nr:NAD-dependent epimerase/dehydratase family protein [Dehalococcoidia bacterium]